ncbi:hypothetical protein M0R45_018922 [Rubus argutus]|uniref:peroxidase n=1 Tax=Rubus argutus TaxID=59490 RepID=A0AAW1X7F5_RUBAR
MFHDGFVDGCDRSILLNSGRESVPKLAFGHLEVHGFDVINLAKSRLEKVCEVVVSCSDIVALAARDAIFMAKGPFYKVPTNQMDGRVSKSFSQTMQGSKFKTLLT